mgnify:FL=1
MLYGCMMGNYDGLYLPMMVLGYVFSVPFFLLTVRTSQKEGQKASLMKYVSVAFICYIGVLVLLLLWGRSDAFTLSIMGDNGLSINLYTILFIAFFGIGYGAYYATAICPSPWSPTAPTTRLTAAATTSPASWVRCSAWWTSWCPACPLPSSASL